MRRTFVGSDVLDAIRGPDDGRATLALPREAEHHLTRVLRLPPGAVVEVFDGSGRIARGRLEPGPPARLVEVELATADDGLPPLVLAQAWVRPAKLEQVVRRATELGASAIWLFVAERSQPRPSRAERKLDRLERIARDAARQSERATLPALLGPLDEAELLERVGAFAGVCAMGVLGAERPLSELVAEAPRGGLLVVVGPEGGLSEAEQERLAAAGVSPCRLGAHVLRTETAGLVALAAAQAGLGKL